MAKSRIKVPKRVAGVKIPKAVRKGPVMDFVNSKTGRVLIAQALTAAIGVLAYKQASPETQDSANDTGDALKRNTARLSAAFGEAVAAFRTALNQPSGESDATSATKALADQLDGVEERVGKKNKPRGSSPSEPANQH
jgi:hypothetical protein